MSRGILGTVLEFVDNFVIMQCNWDLLLCCGPHRSAWHRTLFC